MMGDSLTEENYIRYAMRHYDNPHCIGVEEFQEDISRIVYLKRLFRRYQKDGVLRDRLILNHLITFHNVFGTEPARRLLFFKIEPDLHYILKTFMVFLGYLKDSDLTDIVMDQHIVDRLRRI